MNEPQASVQDTSFDGGQQREATVSKTLPMRINTLENCFSQIGLLGKNAESEGLYAYFKENRNISVSIIEEYEIKDSTAYLSQEYELVLLFQDGECDAVKDVQTKDGKPLYAISYDSFLRDASANEVFDVYHQIIPTLLENGVRVLVVQSPNLLKHPKLTERIPLILSMGFYRLIDKYSSKHDPIFLKALGSANLIPEFSQVKTDSIKGYSRVWANGEKINYDDGFRRIYQTVGTSEACPQIWLFGNCAAANHMLEDSKTIGSFMQSNLKGEYQVVSRSNNCICGNLIMRSCDYTPGDIVVFFDAHRGTQMQQLPVSVLNLSETYYGIPKLHKHITDYSLHMDACVTERCAEAICGEIKKMEAVPPSPGTVFRFGAQQKRIPDVSMFPDRHLAEFVDEIKQTQTASQGTRGAIVMNCNPFTKGHLYLIETAASMVDQLYIFVVQEDKSVFPFRDRFEMVKRGTAHLENVSVYPSGDFMISANTLNGYFDKKHLGNIKLSTSYDLECFAAISSALGITVRFAGNEPNDRFTRQYNQNMKKILPKYGIRFEEIQRREFCSEDGSQKAISATLVRQAIEQGDIACVRNLVPDTTIEILKEKGYFQHSGRQEP